MTTQKLPNPTPRIAGSLAQFAATESNSLRFQLRTVDGDVVFVGEPGESLQDFLGRVEMLELPETAAASEEFTISCTFEPAPAAVEVPLQRRNQDWVEDAT